MHKKITVIDLFAYFTASWGNKWTGGLEDKLTREITFKIWQAMLHTLTQEEINLAISAAIETLDFPPSIAQFKKLALNLLSPAQAYQAAKDGDNKLRQLVIGGDWSWRTYPEDKLRREFYAAYDSFINNKLLTTSENVLENENPELEFLQ